MNLKWTRGDGKAAAFVFMAVARVHRCRILRRGLRVIQKLGKALCRVVQGAVEDYQKKKNSISHTNSLITLSRESV